MQRAENVTKLRRTTIRLRKQSLQELEDIMHTLERVGGLMTSTAAYQLQYTVGLFGITYQRVCE